MIEYRALYLHIPFCKAKCAYCDFDSRVVPEGCAFDVAIDAYLENLDRLIDRHGQVGELAQVETVYIGGGTPSILGWRLPRLVERVRMYCDPVEITCEANPESFTRELAEGLRTAGVTRISLGVQSLQPDELKAIGRIHAADRALEALILAKRCGFSTSCDLMCGLPLQTEVSWRNTLACVIGAGPDHVSVYPLQLEDGTPLARREEAGEIEVPNEDFQAFCMEIAAELLGVAGYERYEVASYAKPGHRCRHNIAYWTGVPYLGLGRSAASMRMVKERTGVPLGTCPFGTLGAAADGREPFCDMPTGYVPNGTPGARERFTQLDDAGKEFERELLTAREAMAEDLMLACRMTDGISPDLLLRATAVIPRNDLEAACDRAVALGLARWENGSLKPTHKGWLEGNELFGLFWNLADLHIGAGGECAG